MKMSVRTRNIIVETICLLFILLFVYAGLSKLLDFENFRLQLGQSPIVSAFAGVIAWMIPALELLIALLLVLKGLRFTGLFCALSLMVMFTAYIFIILNYSSSVPCSCGGILEKMGWKEHLLFNVVFIVLAAAGILILAGKAPKAHPVSKPAVLASALSITVIFSIGIVVFLFVLSDREIKRNNAFVRKYIPHALEKVREYSLESDSFYIAGADENTVYLGNYLAPLYVKSINIKNNNVSENRISIDKTDLPYRRVRIDVRPPYFFLGDGTVPVLFKGSVSNWHAKMFLKDNAYFTQFSVLDPFTLAIATNSGKTGENILGLITSKKDSVHLRLNDTILQKQIDGKFDTDGILLNDGQGSILYVYYYRNQYVLADAQFHSMSIGKTIDTIGKAQLDVAYYKSKNQYKLGGNTVIVNKHSSAYGDLLYVHSDRLGKYEEEKVLQSASIIDVYNFREGLYIKSFYLYHQRDVKLQEFKVYKDLVIALAQDKLWIYRIK